ncbi:MAG: hypothetical protein AAF456_20390, partial [Planctomycetota bacterium]
MLHRIYIAVFALLLFSGCPKPDAEFPAKAPRPVTVVTLEKTPPRGSYVISGQVSSWKTEQIGFEIPGRVQWVLEPGENIIRQIKREDGTPIYDGTELAQIDPSRYKVTLATREAALEVAILDRNVAMSEKEALPGELASAETSFANAVTELQRMQSLRESGAVSAFEVEQAQNNKEAAEARVTTLQANVNQAEQRLQSAEALVRSAEQSRDDAQRDLDNTTLRGGFSQGQVMPSWASYTDLQTATSLPGPVFAQSSHGTIIVQTQNESLNP